ncbi:hypothetical protein WP12_04530 [Sphingomonas sp. SRS2]|nr:hypothetical protein WP12_04530 [Sphingomonas sp. SRS2]
MLITVALRPLVHDRGEGRSKSMRHVMPVITGPVQQIADRVLAHRTVRMPVAGEDKRAATGEWPDRSQHGDRLRRERHKVVAARLLLTIEVALHASRRNAPQRQLAIEILELRPLGAAQLAGPYSRERQHPEAEPRNRPCVVLLGSQDHLAQRHEVGNRRLSALAQRLEHRAQLFRRIARRDPLSDSIDKHGRDALPDPLSGLDRASRLDLAQYAEDQRRGELRDRQITYRRKDVALQTTDDIAGMDRRPLGLGVSMPLASHAFERLTAGFEVRFLLQLLRDYGIMALAEDRIGLVSLPARVG